MRSRGLGRRCGDPSTPSSLTYRHTLVGGTQAACPIRGATCVRAGGHGQSSVRKSMNAAHAPKRSSPAMKTVAISNSKPAAMTSTKNPPAT